MICLHCVNVSWVGGINSFVMSFQKAFSEFQHHILFLGNFNENYDLYKDLQTQGIRCYFNYQITAELIDKINPKIFCIHNPPLSMFPKRLKDFRILQKCWVILFHHAKTKLFPHVDLDIFVSKWIEDMYKDWRQYIKKSKIVHPSIDGTLYLNIKREYTKKKDVMIGRIQSNTNHAFGKFSEDIEMLKKLKKTKFFLVGTGYDENNANKKFTFAPIKIGKMPEYLSKLDIFYIWGGHNHVESWSRVVSEAMMSGLPVVVKDNHDGLAEQARESKACFLVNTEKEFVKIMQKLIDDPKLRKKHGELGRKWASENITIKNLRQDLINEMFEFGVK